MRLCCSLGGIAEAAVLLSNTDGSPLTISFVYFFFPPVINQTPSAWCSQYRHMHVIVQSAFCLIRRCSLAYLTEAWKWKNAEVTPKSFGI